MAPRIKTIDYWNEAIKVIDELVRRDIHRISAAMISALTMNGDLNDIRAILALLQHVNLIKPVNKKEYIVKVNKDNYKYIKEANMLYNTPERPKFPVFITNQAISVNTTALAKKTYEYAIKFMTTYGEENLQISVAWIMGLLNIPYYHKALTALKILELSGLVVKLPNGKYEVQIKKAEIKQN